MCALKKIIIPLILILCLSACNGSSELFEYQQSAAGYNAVISYMGEEFSAVITLSPLNEGARDSLSIEYTEPESISGYTVKREGENYLACISGLEIPGTSESLPQLVYTDALFSLSSENITSIDTDGDGNTVVKVSQGDFGAEAVVVFLSDGRLSSLSLPGAEFIIRIKQ